MSALTYKDPQQGPPKKSNNNPLRRHFPPDRAKKLECPEGNDVIRPALFPFLAFLRAALNSECGDYK